MQPWKMSTRSNGERKTAAPKCDYGADEDNVNDYKPTCLVIFFERVISKGQRQIFTMHCHKLDVVVECFMSTAIITMKGEWTNRAKDTLDCAFALPTPDTIMNVILLIGTDRALRTAIVSKDDAKQLIKKINKKILSNMKKQKLNQHT